MTNTKITSEWLSTTNDYFQKTAPNRIYTIENSGMALMAKFAEKHFHGGLDSKYPFINAKGNGTTYAAMYAGTIGSADTPADNDYTDAAHQEGWGFWHLEESMSHKTRAVNAGPWAKKEQVISLALQKDDALMNQIGELLDYNIVLGDGSNNLILGWPEVFDVANTNYCGLNLTAQFTPKNLQLVLGSTENTISFADMISIWTDMEEGAQYCDAIVAHRNTFKRLRTLSEATVIRDDKGSVTNIGKSRIDVLGSKMYTCNRLPTGASAVVYFFNFGNAVRIGVGLEDKRKVPEGKYWQLEFAGPAPLGFEVSDWMERIDYPGDPLQKKAKGALKMYCGKTEAQGYISIATG